MSGPGHRLPWLDVCKGAGIVLVVVAHVLLLSPNIEARQFASIIYLFHMPFFFLLAGVTLQPTPLRAFARRKARALLLPYVLFLALLGAPALLLACGTGTTFPSLGIDRCAILPFKLLLGGNGLGGIFGVFWFIPCLLFALLLAQALLAYLRGKDNRHCATILTALLLLGYALPQAAPGSMALLSLGLVPTATLLVVLGYLGSRHPPLPNLTLLLSLPLGIAVIAMMAPFDMKHGLYGVPLLGLAGAISLSVLLAQLAQQTARWPPLAVPLQWLGQRTLTILYLHQAVHLTLRYWSVHHDGALILLSLTIPILLHGAVTRLIAAAAAWTYPRNPLQPRRP